MIFFIVVSLPVVFYCAIRLLIQIIDFCKYKTKEKQLAQLKRICAYLKEYKSNPEEAEAKRTKDIIIENEWLYTKNFFFNLNDDKPLEKVRKYLLELMSFFLAYDYAQNKKTFSSLIELKRELNMSLST